MNNVVIFLSSTFADMQKERDLIREKIAPDLADFTQRYGINLEFVDLRWGIDTGGIDENEANSKILRTCFDEIKRTKPFFIVLLGERYGWTPDDDDLLAVAALEGLEIEQLRLNNLEKRVSPNLKLILQRIIIPVWTGVCFILEMMSITATI